MRNNIAPFFAAMVALILLPKIDLVDYSVIPLGVFIVVTALFSRKRPVFFPQEILIAIVALFFLQAIALISSIYYEKIIAEEIFFKPARLILILVMLSICFSTIATSIRTVENVIIVAAVVNGAIIFVQYVLHNMGISIDFMLAPGFSEEVNAPFRKPGMVAGYPIAGLLGVYGVTVLLNRLSKEGGKYTLSLFIVCSMSVLLTSRMALLMLIFVVFVYGIYSLFVGSKLVWVGIGFIGIIPASAILLGVVHHDTINVMFELFINYKDEGQFSSLSGAALLESYGHWPQSLESFMLGNGFSAKSDDGYTVDSSAQIMLFGGGVLALIGYNLLLIFYFITTLKYSKAHLLIFIIFVLDIIANVKMNSLFSRVIGDVLTLLFVSHVYTRYAQKLTKLDDLNIKSVVGDLQKDKGKSY